MVTKPSSNKTQQELADEIHQAQEDGARLAQQSHLTPVQEAEQHYSSVQDQIGECISNIEIASTNIAQYRNLIKEQQAFIKSEQARKAKLRAKKRVFASAKFQLEQIDEDM